MFFDPRGTGKAEPALECPEFDQRRREGAQHALSVDEEIAYRVSALRACRESLLAGGINLKAFTSAAVAADAHELMRTLGYSTFNVRGSSYGTRYALTLLRDAPEEVRSAIFDATVPVQENLSSNYGASAWRAFKTLSAACAADAACNASIPNLDTRILEVATELGVSPLTLQPLDGATGQPYTYVLTGARFLNKVRSLLYDTSLLGRVPAYVRAAAERNSALLALYEPPIAPGTLGGTSAGAGFTILCADEAPFFSTSVLERATSDLPAALRDLTRIEVEVERQACAFWGAAEEPALENEPVRSSVPTLLLVGEHDPVTPPAFSLLAASTLMSARVVEVRSVGHGALFSPTGETARPRCAVRIASQFLDDPLAALDTACLADVPQTAFIGL